MKRLGLLVLLIFAALTGAAAQLAKKYPAPDTYVDDYAHVLTPGGSAQILTLCRQIHDQTRAQIYLVTVPSLEGETIAQFSNDLFHQWKIGEKGTDRGILVVFATGDHRHRIEVGYGFEGVLNDAKAGDIGRAITPALHVGHYDEAGLAAITQIAAVVTPDAKLDATPADTTPATPPATDEQVAAAGTRGGFILLFIFLGIVGFFVLLIYLGIKQKARDDASGVTAQRRKAFFAGSGIDSSSNSDSDSSSDSSESSDSSSDSGDGGDSGGGGADGSD